MPKGAKKNFQKLFYIPAFPPFPSSFSLQTDRVRSGESLSNFSPTLLQDRASLGDFEQMQQKIPITGAWKGLWKLKEEKRSKRQMKVLKVTWCVKKLGRVNSKSYVAATNVCRTISCFCIFQSRNEPFLCSGLHFRWEGRHTDMLSVHELSYCLLWLLRRLTLCAAQGRLQPTCSSSLVQGTSLQLFLNPQRRACYLATVLWFPKKMRSVR